MNFALLWIEVLLISLLWVATLAAFVGRLKRRWVRGLLVSVVLGVPLFFLGTFVFGASVMKFSTKIEPSWFIPALSLLLAYLVGSSLVLSCSRRREPGLVPAAATWPRGALLFAMLTTATVGYMTLLNMDLVIRARCAIESVGVNSIYLATLPAISSDSQNAAPLYEKAFARLKDSQAEQEEVENPPTGRNDNFDPNEPATVKFLAHQAATLALLREAAALPACRFDQDLAGTDLNAMLSSLNEERNAANVLNLDAREQIAQGHISAAVADADAINAMSRQFGERPMIISALVAMGIDAIGNRTLEETLPEVKKKDELAGLHLEQRPFFGRMLQQSLRGEERFGLAIHSNMPPTAQGEGKGIQTPNTQLMSSGIGLPAAFFRVFLLDSDGYMKLMEKLQDLSPQPYYKTRDQLEAVYAAKDGRGLLTSLLIPGLSRTMETCAKVEASDACTQTAVAMTRFRLDHASLPAHLADLVPAYLESVPLDPFDGKPLRLAIKNDQWIIYSVGPDLVDHGGVESTPKQKGDLIFTLRLAKTH